MSGNDVSIGVDERHSQGRTVTKLALSGMLLASFSILACTLADGLARGTAPTAAASVALAALAILDLTAVYVLRSGRVRVAAALIVVSLWTAGTVMSWIGAGLRDPWVVAVQCAVFAGYLLLPRWAGSVVGTISVAVLWLMVARELRVERAAALPHPVETGLTLTAVVVLCSLLAVGTRMALQRAEPSAREARSGFPRIDEGLLALLRRTNDIFYRFDERGYITYVSDSIAHYGYDPSKVIGTHVLELVHPDDRELAHRRIEQRRRGQLDTDTLEIRLKTADGEGKTAEYTAQAVSRVPVLLLESEGIYEQGTGPFGYIGSQGIARDVTNRKSAEAALKESQEKYAKVFQLAPAGIAVSTIDGARFLDVNKEIEKITGYTRHELLGRSMIDLEIWVDPQLRERITAHLLNNETVRDVEALTRTKDGELRTVRFNGQLIDIGGVACLLSAVEDITERKRLESQLRQAQKLEAIGRLAGGIAHDFNNMLAVILGRAELAQNIVTPANRAYESIQEIRKAAERSAQLTRQLLVFARRQDTAPHSLNLNEAVGDRLPILRRLIGDNIALRWNPSPVPWFVTASPEQVDQILINLVVNARDAIADVGTLTLSTENRRLRNAPPDRGRSEGGHEWIVLTVEDTGSGIQPETLSHIFEPFFTTKDVGKGTGLGLATVHGIVESCGGWIDVDSELGKGTTFRIFLPRTRREAERAERGDPAQLVGGSETLLVVEDEPAIRELVRISLQRVGYTVIAAASAGEALSLAAHHAGNFDLLLTDVVMPEMNGRDLYSRIAQVQPEIGVIFMSGYSADVFPGSDAAVAGLTLLQKPFGLQQLSATVRAVLDNRRIGRLSGRDSHA